MDWPRPGYSSNADRRRAFRLQSVHVSLGMCLAVVLALRIIWRVGPGRRLPPAASGIAEVATKLVHYALYVLLAL